MHASAKFSHWAGRRSHGLAITGASGWIGRAMAHAAASAEGTGPLRLFGSRAGSVAVAGETRPLEALAGAAPLGEGEWIVLHLAVAGADRQSDPAKLAALNDRLLAEALRLTEGATVRRFVAASSGAVHQQGQGSSDKQAYAALKAGQEKAVRDWAARTGTPLLIPRIFNVGGPYMNHPERYALGSLTRQALDGGPLSIAAARPVIRSYVHVLELARVVLDQALAEADDILLETQGAQAVEMQALAEAVRAALDLSVEIRRPPMGPDAPDRYVGDGARYREALAATGAQQVGLEQIIRDTADWLAALKSRAAASDSAKMSP